MKALRWILAAAAVLLAASAAAADDALPRLRVHLPRTVTVEADAIRLGMISVVRAEDEALERLATDLPMGRSPWDREELVIDRPTVLGRLASQGLKGDCVELTGADRVVITRRHAAVGAEDLVRAAKAFLEEQSPAPKGCAWRLLREPEALAVPAGGKTDLVPRRLPRAVDGEACIEVAAAVEGRQIGAVQLVFRLGHPHYRLVAVADVPVGSPVRPDNTEMQTVLKDQPQPGTWAPPYGQVALRPIRAGEAVDPNLVRPSQPKLLVRRNDNVVMRITGELFQVTDIGQAQENGYQGELIRVRNVGSGRIIIARVMADGSVEPAFAGAQP
jgi:flagella basal body P-ring formation protein FlgA